MPTPCPSCNKLCSLENADPETNDLELSEGQLSASVRLVRNSACCGNEMKEYTYEPTLDVSEDIAAHEAKHHNGEAQDYTVNEEGCESDESGGGRYKKNMISISLSVSVTCDGEHPDKTDAAVGTYDLTDDTNAGSFDELN